MRALGNFVFAIVVLVIVSNIVEGAAGVVAGSAPASGSRSTRNENDPSPFWAARGKRAPCKNCEEEVPAAMDFEEPMQLKHFSLPNPLFSNPKVFQRFRGLSDPSASYNYYDDSGSEPFAVYYTQLRSHPQLQLHYAPGPSVADLGYVYSPLHKPASKKLDAGASDQDTAPFWAARG